MAPIIFPVVLIAVAVPAVKTLPKRIPLKVEALPPENIIEPLPELLPIILSLIV